MKTLEEQAQENKNRIDTFKAKYPILFSKLEWLDIQDGWLDLIDHLSGIIQFHIDGHVPDELKDQIYFTDIKQKLGGLRLHVNHWIPYIQGAIAMAEDLSYQLCEVCGKTGTTHNVRNWLTTLCDVHLKEAQEKKTR